MSRKKRGEVRIAETEGGLTPSIVELPADASSLVSQILAREDLTPGERRRGVLIALGLRTPRKRYKTKQERKDAAAARRLKRKEERLKIFEQYGITPRKKSGKLTPEQKKKKRSERGKKRRALFRDMVRANPEIAKRYGIDPSRFRDKPKE